MEPRTRLSAEVEVETNETPEQFAARLQELLGETATVLVAEAVTEAAAEVQESGNLAMGEVSEAASPSTLETWRANDYRQGPVTLIREGWNTRGTRYYTRTAMESGSVFDGAQMFANHQTKAEKAAQPEGDITRLVGIVRDPQRAGSGGAIVGTAKVVQESWRSFLKAADEVGELGSVALSVNANVMERNGSVDGRKGSVVESFIGPAQGGKHPRVDFVTIAGAGGRLAEAAEAWAATAQQESTDMDLNNLTLEQLKKERGDLVGELRGEIKESVYGEKAEADTAAEALRIELETAKAKVAELESAQTAAHRATVLEAAVAEIDLPSAYKALVAEAVAGKEYADDDALKAAVTEQATKHKAALAEVTESGKVKGFDTPDKAADTDAKLTRTRRTFGEPIKAPEKQ